MTILCMQLPLHEDNKLLVVLKGEEEKSYKNLQLPNLKKESSREDQELANHDRILKKGKRRMFKLNQ